MRDLDLLFWYSSLSGRLTFRRNILLIHSVIVINKERRLDLSLAFVYVPSVDKRRKLGYELMQKHGELG